MTKVKGSKRKDKEIVKFPNVNHVPRLYKRRGGDGEKMKGTRLYRKEKKENPVKKITFSAASYFVICPLNKLR